MTDIATHAVSPQPEFRSDFAIRRRLPSALAALDEISMNFYWSWQPEGVALFRDIDPALWDGCEQNPRLFLKSVSDLKLYQRAADTAYLDRLEYFTSRFREYTSTSFSTKIAYFCAEYGVHNSLPNYSGGLGILAGDHLKSASDLGLPLTAVGLLYRYGYFRQRLSHDGWQEETYRDIFDGELALTPVTDGEGQRIFVAVHIRGREVAAQAWTARVGRVTLYLLDTNLPQNSEVDRLITGHLYGGDTETRIVQEKVLGIGGVRLLRRLGIEPDVLHLNEGHAAFSTLELAREYLADHSDAGFADAAAHVGKSCVFTTHTPVAAGNDAFPPDVLSECFSKKFIESLKLSKDEFLALGRADLSDDKEHFGMTPLALRMCRSANGVSRKHGEVSRDLWLKMFPGTTGPDEVPITSVTNGVHAPTWIAPAFQALYEAKLGRDWHKVVVDPSAWAAMVASLDDRDIWTAHLRLKELLIAFIRKRTRAEQTGDVDTIHEHESTRGLFSADALTIGFARRVAAYKRWDLILTDLDRLLRLVDDDERPLRLVFAGKAHPQDRTAKTILQKLLSINHDSKWQRRAIFVEDYDQEAARYLVQGVDVWLNVPRRPLEASGTSGMKAAMNGVLNFSILDGWWIEGWNGRNGYAIAGSGSDDPGADETVDSSVDLADAESFYNVLENEIIPAYYSDVTDGVPSAWVGRMKDALATLTPQFSSDRMVREYLSRIYSEE